MTPRWSEEELRAELARYEAELRAAGKARNTVNTYVDHPERFINWLVGRYSPGNRRATPQGGSRRSSTSTYAPLTHYLDSRGEPVVQMTFRDIENVIGRPLPASARKYRPWWANEEGGTHVHARAWIEAGRRTARVDLNAETVEFER